MRVAAMRWRLLVACVPCWLLACSTTPETPPQAVDAPVAEVTDAAVDVPVDVPADVADIADVPDTPENVDVPPMPDEPPPPDVPPPCEGEVGCACEKNADCLAEACVEGADGGKVCAGACELSADCPEPLLCLPSGAPVPGLLCLPPAARLCQPCSADSDCQEAEASLGAGACVSYGDAGSFCGVFCGEDGACPADFACQNVDTVDGQKSAQCMREAGDCACSSLSVLLALSTTCLSSTADGSCAGERYCQFGGLSACDAPQPTPEICDGVDNNCNAEIDEAADCDDANPCTTDSCDGEAGCQNSPNTEPCEDGDACTVGDVCADGGCAPGEAAVCEDGNDCTNDDCDATTGCTATPNTASCDDGDDCTTSDACADSACVGGAAVNCDDGLLCTDDSCIPASGCAWVPNAAACDDSDACTSDDACVDGACQGGAPIACNDDNPCTDDACLPGSGCAYVPNTQPCDDGAFCTDADMCSGGACVPGPPLNCGALDACQVSVTCDDDLDECAVETAPDGTSCNDGDSCTVDDTCAAGDCVAGAPYDGCPVSQDDCLAYACQSQGPEQQPKCVLGPLPAGSECQDGLFCTVDDACNAAGECEPGAPRDCSDAAVICQTGVCDDEDDVCKAAQAVDKTPCDDGDPCTVDSLCLAGVCAVQGWACADHQISVFDSVEGATTPDLASVGDGRFVAAWYAKGGTDVRARAVNRYMGLEDTSQQTPAGGSSRREVQVAALADGGAVTGFIVRKLSYKNTPDPCKQCCISNDPKCKADPCPNWKLLGDGCKKCDGSAPNCGNTCNQTIHKGSILREERVTLVWRDANNNIVAGPLNVLKKDDFSKSWGNICNQPGNPGHSVDIHDLRLTGLGDGRTVMLVTFGGVPTGRLLSPTGTVELNLSLGWTSSAGHDVAALDDTSFVVVWSDGKVIRAQPYTSAGVAAGPQIIVAADNGATQVEPSAVGLPGTGGRFAVGWETNVTGDWDIRTQVAKIGGLIGPQIVANTVAAGQQRMASVGAFDSGGFVVAWEDDHGQDGDGDGIFARFLGKGGEPVTQQRQINIGSGGDQQLPVAVGLDDGRAIIAWRNPAGHVLARGFDAGGSSVEIAPERVIAAADDVSSDSPRAAATPGGGALVAYRSSGDSGATAAVWVQRYAADEQPAGAPTSLGAATQTGNLGLGSQPDIATDATGAAIVVWDPYGLDGEFEGIFGIRLTAAGALTGSALQINQYTLSTQNAPAVARALDGRFAVAWTSLTQPGGDGTDVMLRCYSADASPLSEEVFAHPVVTKNQQTPRLAAFNDLTKRFVAVWMSRDMPGDPGWGIQARIFDEKCQPTGEPFQINGDTTGDQHTPHVATALQVGGGFTVGWTGVDASGAGAFARRFDSDGLQQGGELQLNTFVSNGQWVGDIASYPSGAMLVGWRSGGEDGSTAVVLRGLSAKGEAAGLPFIANPTFSGEQSRPSVSVLSTGKTLLLWQNKPGAVSQVLGRWLSAP